MGLTHVKRQDQNPVGWLPPTNVFGRSPVVVSGSLVGVLLMGRSTVTLFTGRIFFVARLDRLVRRSRSMSFPARSVLP